MFYIDTSVLIALLVGDKPVDKADEWMRRQSGTTSHIGQWTFTEFSSALSAKSRAENTPPS
ncbi:MAG: hypothetical protein PW791_07760 [Neorhizobium sp.]|nr:hypothetical protein [Neorhizobium sp.]